MVNSFFKQSERESIEGKCIITNTSIIQRERIIERDKVL